MPMRSFVHRHDRLTHSPNCCEYRSLMLLFQSNVTAFAYCSCLGCDDPDPEQFLFLCASAHNFSPKPSPLLSFSISASFSPPQNPLKHTRQTPQPNQKCRTYNLKFSSLR